MNRVEGPQGSPQNPAQIRVRVVELRSDGTYLAAQGGRQIVLSSAVPLKIGQTISISAKLMASAIASGTPLLFQGSQRTAGAPAGPAAKPGVPVFPMGPLSASARNSGELLLLAARAAAQFQPGMAPIASAALLASYSAVLSQIAAAHPDWSPPKIARYILDQDGDAPERGAVESAIENDSIFAGLPLGPMPGREDHGDSRRESYEGPESDSFDIAGSARKRGRSPAEARELFWSWFRIGPARDEEGKPWSEGGIARMAFRASDILASNAPGPNPPPPDLPEIFNLEISCSGQAWLFFWEIRDPDLLRVRAPVARSPSMLKKMERLFHRNFPPLGFRKMELMEDGDWYDGFYFLSGESIIKRVDMVS